MPKLDGLKEEIAYFKFVLGVVIAIFTALLLLQIIIKLNCG